MALIGSAYVEIRALDTNLQRDINNAMKKIKDVTLKIEADVNLAPVREKIAALREEIKTDPLKFVVEVEDSKVVDSLAEAHQLYEDNPLNIIAHTDTASAETALRAVREEFRHLPSTVTANANTAAAEGQLAVLTRRRSVGIFPNIRIAPDFQRALKGITSTIMGAIPAAKVRASLTSVLANFEMLTIGAAKALTVIGSLGAMALTTGANLLTFGADIGRTIGLLTTAPAILTSMILAMVSLKLAFKDFGGAFSSDAKKAAEAMAKLPLEAQAAVKAMKGLGSEIRKDSQGAFWKEMGTDLQDTVEVIFPIFKKGMHDISISTAKMTKGMLSSFKELAESGGMETLLTNVNKGLDATSKAVKPFFDAMNTISLTGSKHLERYGTKLTAVAERFDAWATRTSQSGEMDQWITQAGANMHNLGRLIGETVNTFKGLTQAAEKAGGKGLADFAEGMKNIAGIVNSEPFQSKLVQVLIGAREGVAALGRGFDSIKKTIGNGTAALSGFLNLAGQVGGSFMTNIAAMFDGTGLGAGLIEAMDGAKQAMDLMKPAFSDFGTMIGDIGEIASVLFVNMAPGFNNLADTLQKIVAGLKKGVEDVIPVFNVFIQNILMVIAPIIVGIADAVGVLLEGFAALPEIFRNAILAVGLFLLALKMLQRPMLDTRTGLRNLASPIQNLQNRLDGFRDSVVGKWNTSGTVGALKQSISGLVGTASVTAGAVGQSFSQMRWMGAHAATAIADGFKKSFSQFGDQLKKLGTPIREFGSMMGKVMGEALWPRDVRDGFKGVGQKLGEVARIYTGYFTAAKDKIVAIGKSLASVFPASMLGPALKALPGEVGKALAFAGQKVADGVTNIAKTLAGPAVGFAMGKMREVIQAQSLYASKHLENIGKGMGTAVNAIKAAPAAIGGALSKLGSTISAAASTAQQSLAKAFNTTVLAAAINPMTAPFVKMADAARTGALQAASHVGTMAKSIGTAVNTITVPARTAFAGLAVAASMQAGIIADKFKNAAGTVGGNFATAFKNAGRDLSTVASNMTSTMGKVFTGISTAATTAASAVTSTMQKAGGALASNFAPAIAAVRGTFDALPASLRPAAGAMADFGRSAGNTLAQVGSFAKAGIRGAAAGLMEVLGGGWGVALAAATAALTIYAQEAGKSKARVDELARSLDQTTGAMTALSKTAATKLLFDGVTDDWDDFVRGFVQGSRTVEEMLDNLGISTKHYSDTMADPEGRDKLIKGMKDTSIALLYAQDISQEMADSLGLSKDYLNDLSWEDSKKLGLDLEHASKKAEGMAKELAKAEAQIKLVAEATGLNTGQAAIMSKNYDILAKSTTTVADKFSALKENMSLLSSPMEKAQLGQKGYQQSLRDTATKIKDIADANKDLLLPSLFEIGTGFVFTKQAGADLHTALQGQVEGIQMLGAEGIQKALAEGKKGAQVQEAALAAMKPGIDALKQTLKDMKFSPEQVQGILDTFNLMDKDITSSITLEGAEEAQRKIILTKAIADAFASGNYKAMLAALPDAAKKAIADATGKGKEYAEGDYESVLKAFDGTAGGREAALAAILGTTNGDYKAAIKSWDDTVAGRTAAFEAILKTTNGDYKAAVAAWDATSPGRGAAIEAILKTTNGDYKAAIKAYLDKGTADATEAGIRSIASKQYSASIKLLLGPMPAIPASLGGPRAANGALLSSVTDRSSLLAGNFPMQVKAFANGGIERHVAQIAPAGAMRLWAEPETGGEAYLPLGKSKRPRSLKILEQVAEMFGFSLVKGLKFANGGILSGMKAKSPSISRESLSPRTTMATIGSSSSPTVITNVYPSAGLNEEQVADSVSENIYWKLSTQI